MTDNRLKIAFMGTPDFALEALKAVHAGPHEIVCVYTQPPRPKGRGHKVQPSPTHAYAEENGIPVHHPKSLKSKEEQEIFASYKPDVVIVAAYGLILPKAILDAPKYGCINIHASLLPRWRGASPIQRSIWEGDSETGVTLMQMDEGLDTGPEISKRSISITSETTASSLHDELAELGGEMIAETLNKLANEGALQSTPQDNIQSTYAPLLTKDNGRINWSQTADQIDRQIRALNPWPGIFTELNGQRFKILKAEPIKDAPLNANNIGKLENSNGLVICGGLSTLQLKIIQPAGKQPMDIKSAINGNYIKVGDVFE